MVIALILSFVAGFLTHFTNGFIRKVSLPGWRSVSFYMIRSVLKIPAILVVGKELQKDIEDPQRLMLTSYSLASAAYGVGVIFAWFFNEERS